jgi:polyhydroxyalkanoate synthesis repressor PhaR
MSSLEFCSAFCHLAASQRDARHLPQLRKGAHTMNQVREEAPQVQVVVKKYANRRLYNTESSTYITLDSLAQMVREERDFIVFDAKSGEDITRSVLTQIIVEEESRDGRAMLPINFLRQLIVLYGHNLQAAVPRYLESAMTQFGRQQRQLCDAMQETMGRFFPPGIEEIGRQNMAMIERAMRMFAPFTIDEDATADPGAQCEEVAALRAEVERLQAELLALRQTKST